MSDVLYHPVFDKEIIQYIAEHPGCTAWDIGNEMLARHPAAFERMDLKEHCAEVKVRKRLRSLNKFRYVRYTIDDGKTRHWFVVED